jgi:ribose 5-phosphate isomerase B
MRLVIGSDHAGWPLKRIVSGHEVVGSYDDQPVDFSDIARAWRRK